MSKPTLPLRKKRPVDQSEACLSGYISAIEDEENERRSTNELKDWIDVLTAMITQMSVHISDLDKNLVVHELTDKINEQNSIKNVSTNLLDESDEVKSSASKKKPNKVDLTENYIFFKSGDVNSKGVFYTYDHLQQVYMKDERVEGFIIDETRYYFRVKVDGEMYPKGIKVRLKIKRQICPLHY